MTANDRISKRRILLKMTASAAFTLAFAGTTAQTAHARGGHDLTPVPGEPIACSADGEKCKFQMLRSPAVVNNKSFPNCGIGANGRPAAGSVKIESEGPVEEMKVSVDNLPPNTNFDFFVIQGANGPFGMAWYQGDIETDEYGRGSQKFVGRFNIETFIVAPGSIAAPFVHNNAPNQDATVNPATGPIHTYHLGLWFNSPADAVKSGCPGVVTPFNGEHNAGLQILNTSQFPDKGPLFFVK